MTPQDERRVREIARQIALEMIQAAAPIIVQAQRERPEPGEWR